MIVIDLPLWAVLAWAFVACPLVAFLIGYFGTKLLDRSHR